MTKSGIILRPMIGSPTHEEITTPARDFNAFVEQWGEKSGFENQEQLRRLWLVAEQSYGTPPLEYHNFDHALDVLWKSMELADLCEDRGDAIDRDHKIGNRQVLICAALFHDAGFQDDFRSKNNLSPEEYSADIFTNAAQAENMSETDIYRVRHLILATTPGFKPEYRDERILIRADLDNIGGNYSEDFFPANIALLKETRFLAEKRGEAFDQKIFASNSIQILAEYISQSLSLSPVYDNEYPEWYSKALNNLKKYAFEQAIFNELDLGTFIKYIGSPLVDRLVLGASRFEQEASNN